MRKVFYVSVFLFALIFTGCSNFMNGSVLAKEINDAVSYANTDDYSIYVSAEKNQGVTVPLGSQLGKIGTKEELHFTESNGYKFIKWMVVDSSTGEELEDTVEIEDSFSIDTFFKVIRKRGNVRILPLCFTSSDKTSPELDHVKVYKANVDGSQGVEISDKHFDQWIKPANKNGYSVYEGTEYASNIVKSLWIDFSGSDDDSGIYGLQIKETLLKDTEFEISQDFVNTRVIEKNSISVDSKNEWSKKFHYEFQESTMNGKVKLEISLIDFAGNVSEKTYTYWVYKDIVFNGLNLSNNVFMHREVDMEDETVTISQMKKDINRIVIQVYDYPTGSNTYEPDPLDFNISLTCKGRTYALNKFKRYFKDGFAYYYIDLDLDENEDTLLVLSAEDGVGNKKTVSGIVHKAPSVISYKVMNSDSGSYNGVKYSINAQKAEEASFINVLRSSVPASQVTEDTDFYFNHVVSREWNTPVRKYNGDCYEKLSESWGASTDCISTSTAGSNEFPEEYMFYVSSVYEIQDVNSYCYLAGHLSPSISFKKSAEEGDFSIPRTEMQIKSLGKNSGKTEVLFRFDGVSDMNQDDLIYFLYPDGRELLSISGGKSSVVIPTSSVDKEKFSIIFIKNGKEKFISKKDTGLLTIKGEAVDNTPPVFDVTYYRVPDCTGQYYALKNPVDDSGFKLTKGKATATIYFTPLENEDKYLYMDVVKDKVMSPEVVKACPSVPFTFDYDNENPATKTYLIPINNIPDGEYLLVGSIEDINGNVSYQPFARYSVGSLKKPVISGTGTNVNVKDENFHDYYYLEEYDAENKKWKTASETPQIDLTIEYNYKELIKEKEFGKNGVSFTTAKKGYKFLRMVLKDTFFKNDRWSMVDINYHIGEYLFSSPVCFYTGVDTSKEIEKVIVEGNGGYIVYHNYPCYVHTLYSETDWGNDPEVWEKRVLNCDKTNPKVCSNGDNVSGSSAYTLKLEDIPSKKYYATIFHFADGTELMSNVKWKN